MKLRKHMGLVVAGVIALVLALAALVMLFKFRSAYDKVRTDLRSTLSRLDQLYNRDPYPSPENVALVQSNLYVLDGYFTNLFATLKEGQPEPVRKEPAEFPLLLDATIRKLYGRAKDLGVLLPPRFAFGFERYALGSLPNQEDVPRLVLQVNTVDRLCDILYRAKIAEIKGVERTVFEKGAVAEEPTGGRRRRGGQEEQAQDASSGSAEAWVDPSGLYARETYVLKFKAYDSAVWTLLDLLAQSKMFVVVSAVTLANETPIPKASAQAAVRPGAAKPAAASILAAMRAGSGQPAPGGAPEAPALPVAREERIAAGRELVTAEVQVRVYRFLDTGSQENQQ